MPRSPVRIRPGVLHRLTRCSPRFLIFAPLLSAWLAGATALASCTAAMIDRVCGPSVERGNRWHSSGCEVLPEASPAGTSPAMTIRADDIALRDLLEDRSPRTGRSGHGSTNLESLDKLRQMVELQHNRIRFGAVHTRMASEIIHQARKVSLPMTQLEFCDPQFVGSHSRSLVHLSLIRLSHS